MGNSCNSNFGNNIDNFDNDNPISISSNKSIEKITLKNNRKNNYLNSGIPFNYDSVLKYLNNNNILNLFNENSNIENLNFIKKFDTEFKYLKYIIFEEKGEKLCMIKELNFTEETKKYFEQLNLIIELKLNFLLKCQGYIPLDNKILLIYPFISNNLTNLIKKDILDFSNKLIITENLLLCLKICHKNNLTFKYVNIDTIFFVGKNLKMKILGLERFIDEKKEEQSKIDITIIGKILLQIFSGNSENNNINNLDLIDNLYIKAFIIGLIREVLNELPNEDNIIEIFNLIKNNINHNKDIT